MLVIRLARGGSKKRPFYQIIATDSRNARDGRFIERLGYFNPIARGGEIRLKVDLEAVDQWVQKGAQLSDRVKTLVKEARKSESA
ncbi:30S ribosomal protein S16 [Alloalcanivorax dieselolei B5]|uniref:Small ribosomal subunit protein bS16 n=2 Tax=Alcanivoracaceae TaxID=224372 RepID=K0C871_ALCDB|nr:MULTISPECIES: 30S ribosomal protein S16 [Alcanivoracaceae]AFT69699.1 30S ribosomal protein S16 [Alloalcanivorax dieselolei B5]KAF0807112.1 30S ribosomal protein S16 [Alcanivorax xiamenensis]GGJ86300.1 30S ribosomal protein S16 [Alloalcanivorax dieselolei]